MEVKQAMITATAPARHTPPWQRELAAAITVQARALELMAQLQAALPGYRVPRLVREETGREAKTLVF